MRGHGMGPAFAVWVWQTPPMRETTLYRPVKAFLEAQGYAVKGEVTGCDLVAIRGDEPPVIVELKTSFSLSLVFQGIVRQDLSDTVYLAVPPFSGRTTRRQDAALGMNRNWPATILTQRLLTSRYRTTLARQGPSSDLGCCMRAAPRPFALLACALEGQCR